ncbi:MAG: hypothetical protein RXQ75_03075 [Acidianus hospitalis]
MNPTYYKIANKVTYEESVYQMILPSAMPQLLTYQPELNYLAAAREKDFYYKSDTSTYISLSLPDDLLKISGRFPYPYPAYYNSGVNYYGDYPSQLFLGYLRVVISNFPRYSPFYTDNGLLYPKVYNYNGSPAFMLNNMSIGAPVYLVSIILIMANFVQIMAF